MQNANIFNLPENYTMKYCKSCPTQTRSCSSSRAHLRLSLALLRADLYHALTWPQLSFVAEEASTGKIVGYILAKMFVHSPDRRGPSVGFAPSRPVLDSYLLLLLSTHFVFQGRGLGPEGASARTRDLHLCSAHASSAGSRQQAHEAVTSV